MNVFRLAAMEQSLFGFRPRSGRLSVMGLWTEHLASINCEERVRRYREEHHCPRHPAPGGKLAIRGTH
jgi:hypothetical protein